MVSGRVVGGVVSTARTGETVDEDTAPVCHEGTAVVRHGFGRRPPG